MYQSYIVCIHYVRHTWVSRIVHFIRLENSNWIFDFIPSLRFCFTTNPINFRLNIRAGVWSRNRVLQLLVSDWSVVALCADSFWDIVLKGCCYSDAEDADRSLVGRTSEKTFSFENLHRGPNLDYFIDGCTSVYLASAIQHWRRTLNNWRPLLQRRPKPYIFLGCTSRDVRYK